MSILLILLAVAIGLGVLLGVLAKMPFLEIAAMSAAMCVAAFVFFTLSQIL